MDREQEPKYPLQTLSKALEILSYMGEKACAQGITLNSLSKSLGISKSSAHRILDTLLYYGFVEKSDSAVVYYQLSWSLYRIGSVVTERHDLESSGYRARADALAREVQRGVCVCAPRDSSSVVLYHAAPMETERPSWSFFVEHLPLYATASGKLFMLDFSKEEVLEYFRSTDIKRYTPNTLLNYIDFLENLERIRERGYSLDDREYDEGSIYVAMPVRDYTGRTVAAISIIGTPDTMQPDQIRQMLPQLSAVSQDLSAWLGHQGAAAEN